MMEKLYLIARIADTRVALRSQSINSVVTVGTPVEVPAAPPHVAGLEAHGIGGDDETTRVVLAPRHRGGLR